MTRRLSTNPVTIRESCRHLASYIAQLSIANSEMDPATLRSIGQRIERATARYHICRERVRSITSPESDRRIDYMGAELAYVRSAYEKATRR